MVMRYPGGKGRCFRSIVTLMWQHDTYIETHLGGGAVMRHKRGASRSIGVELDAKVVAQWRSEPSPGCEIVHGDAIEFIRSFPFVGTELVYSDPPYLAETRRRAKVYRHDYTTAQHVELLEALKGLPCAVMVSGYRSHLYDEMLSGWRSVEFAGDSHTGPRIEVVWLNYSEREKLHDHAHIGEDFRQREQVRRRRNGLMARLQKLEERERLALFDGLVERHGSEIRQALERAT